MKNRNLVVKLCSLKPLRAGKQTPISRAFLLSLMSYCNLEVKFCQGFEKVLNTSNFVPQ